MTAAELRAIVAAMSGGTWQVVDDAEDGEVVHAETGKYICRVCKAPVDDNTRAIVALANHADALVELMRVCERVLGPSQPTFDGALELELALTAVHAVGKETT